MIMNQTRIRLAREDDVLVIESIVHCAYAPYTERIGRRPAPMSDDYAKLVAMGAVWVLIAQGDVAGLIVLEDEIDHILVNNVAVAPKYHGQGFGKMLLAYAESHARQQNMRELRLYTNEKMLENLAIYTKLGWKEYDRNEQDGFRRVFMKKIIK